MKRIKILLTAAFLPVLLCLGCASHYDIRLTNGNIITAKGKPHYDKAHGVWRFTDAKGQPAKLPGGSVVEVEPSSLSGSDNPTFNAR